MFLILISCIAPSNSDIKGMFAAIIIGIIIMVIAAYAVGWAVPSVNVYVKNSILLVGKFYASYLAVLTAIVTVKGCIVNRTINPIYILQLYKALLLNVLQIMARCS